jgi:hypothetical protein
MEIFTTLLLSLLLLLTFAWTSCGNVGFFFVAGIGSLKESWMQGRARIITLHIGGVLTRNCSLDGWDYC